MSENKALAAELGNENIGKLIKKYAIPGIIAMTAVSLYNMIDSIYIGHIKDVGSYAISAIAVTFPLMNLSIALGTLVGVGAATMISILLGQKNYKAANKVLTNEITICGIVSIIFTIVTLIYITPILHFFGASENTIGYAKEYMTIILLGNIISNQYFGLNNCIRSSGSPKVAMGLTLFTVICNTILDPIFIFGLNMGVRGAAIATVISQAIALLLAWKFFRNKDRLIHIPDKFLNLDFKIAKDFLSIGIGPFLMNTASCVVTISINQQMRRYGGDLSIGAFGIDMRLTFLFVMTVMGLNQGMQPIAGYNYGARKYSRMKSVYKYTALWGTLVTIVGFLISFFFSKQAVSIFTSDPLLQQLAAKGLKTMNLIFPVIGFQMVTTIFFQCIGMIRKSIILSLSRQLLFLVPLIYILPNYLGADGVWYSFPISDGLAATLTTTLIILLLRKINTLKDGDDPKILGSQI